MLFPRENCMDMPAMLRGLAGDIASGAEDATSCTVVLRRSEGGVAVFAYGEIDSVRAFMDLHAGAAELLR